MAMDEQAKRESYARRMLQGAAVGGLIGATAGGKLRDTAMGHLPEPDMAQSWAAQNPIRSSLLLAAAKLPTNKGALVGGLLGAAGGAGIGALQAHMAKAQREDTAARLANDARLVGE
jgi:hypothetical protein